MENINTKDYWNSVYQKEWSQNIFRPDYYRRRAYAHVHERIIELIPDEARVLDAGCGFGILCREIKKHRPKAIVYGIDFSEFAIEKNRQIDKGSIFYEYVDINTEFRMGQMGFDVVIMCEVIEHLENPQHAISNVMRLLVPGGLLILTCPHDMDFISSDHLHFWTHDTLFHFFAEYSDEVTFAVLNPPSDRYIMVCFRKNDVGPGKMPTQG